MPPVRLSVALVFVAMTQGLGLISENLYPDQTGRDYHPSRYLAHIKNLRGPGHRCFRCLSSRRQRRVRAEASILTATPVGSAGRATNTISLDPSIAKHFGEATRFSSLVLSVNGSNSPCYTESGAMVPPQSSASALFDQLFVDDSRQARQQNAGRIRQARSITPISDTKVGPS
jgi:hypothetical protein